MAQMPGPPDWRPLNAGDEDVYKGANEIIELAYKEYKSRQESYLLGSIQPRPVSAIAARSSESALREFSSR